MTSPVDRVIEGALREAAPRYAARSIRVEPHLAATIGLATHDAVLESALALIFRGLPAHLAAGSTLRVWTHDRAGGDIEVVWECEEVQELDDPDATDGDLFALAIDGLETLCRARHGRAEARADPVGGGVVRRRRTFLIPPVRRPPGWEPRAGHS